jgi:hypothetical protein
MKVSAWPDLSPFSHSLEHLNLHIHKIALSFVSYNISDEPADVH